MEKYQKILPPRYHNVSYENDVPGAIKDEVKKQINKKEGIYFLGGAGVGKTHIACAIAKELLSKNIPVMFLNTGKFLEEIRLGFNGDADEFGGIFKEVLEFEGVLILDDIGAEKATEWVRERLYLIINERYDQMRPIIFTSNNSISELSSKLGDRIASRIVGMSLTISLDGIDRRNI